MKTRMAGVLAAMLISAFLSPVWAQDKVNAAKPAANPAASVPAPAKGVLQQANSLSFRQQYPEAVELYKKAAASEPKNPQVFHMYGRTLALMGDMSGAIEQYKKAVELSPNNAELVNDLGVAYSANGQHPEAIAQFKRVLALKPGFVAALNNMGVTMMEGGDYQGAVDAFKASLKMQPRNTFIQKKLTRAQSHLGSAAASTEGSTTAPASEPAAPAGTAKP